MPFAKRRLFPVCMTVWDCRFWSLLGRFEILIEKQRGNPFSGKCQRPRAGGSEVYALSGTWAWREDTTKHLVPGVQLDYVANGSVSERRNLPFQRSEETRRQAIACGPEWLAQNCEMNFQASGGTKAFRPSSPVEFPSSTDDGVCGPSNVHALTG